MTQTTREFGNISDRHTGRAELQSARKAIEGWITAGVTAAKLGKVEPRDDRSAGRFDLDIDFTSRPTRS